MSTPIILTKVTSIEWEKVETASTSLNDMLIEAEQLHLNNINSSYKVGLVTGGEFEEVAHWCPLVCPVTPD